MGGEKDEVGAKKKERRRKEKKETYLHYLYSSRGGDLDELLSSIGKGEGGASEKMGMKRTGRAPWRRGTVRV